VADCPALLRAVADSSPILVAIVSAMLVMFGNELRLTTRARGWNPAPIPGQAGRTGVPAARLGPILD
jgi:hypothetical protein